MDGADFFSCSGLVLPSMERVLTQQSSWPMFGQKAETPPEANQQRGESPLQAGAVPGTYFERRREPAGRGLVSCNYAYHFLAAVARAVGGDGHES